ncbi:MAG: hypothetical protein ACI976_002690, partial [Aureispira sp.]
MNIISKTLLFLSLFIVNNLFGQTNVYTISGVVKAS